MAYRISQPLAPTQFPPDKKKRQQRKKNRAIDKEDKRKRKAEIKRQATKSRSGLKAEGTYDVDVSGERKVKKKVAKIQKKIDNFSDKKDARQKKLVKSGVRRETRKNQLLQKQVEAKRVTKGKLGEAGKRTKEKVPKDNTVTNKSNTKAKKSRCPLPSGKYKPIKRGIQINRTKTGGGGKRRSNNAIQKGKSILGKNKKI